MPIRFLLAATWLLLLAAPALAQSQGPDYLEMGLRERDDLKQIEYLTKAINQEPTKVAYLYRGLAYIRQNQASQAIQDLEAGLETPKRGPYQLEVAVFDSRLTYLYYAIGEYTKAVQYGNAALQADPDNEIALQFRGWSHLNLERYNQALRDFSAWVDVDPQDADRWYTRSIVYYRQENYSDALNDIDEALALAPDESLYKQRKSLILNRLGRNEEAEELLRGLVDFNQDDPISLVNIGLVYYQNGDNQTAITYYNDAMQLYEEKIEHDPEFRKKGKQQLYTIFLNRGDAHFAASHYQEALADYSQAANVNPDDHIVWNKIGSLQSDQRNFEESIRAFERCFRIKPDYPYGWVNLGFAYGELGRDREAVEVYNRALKVPGIQGKGLILNNRGFSYLNLKEYEKCRRDLEAAIAEDPGIAMSHISLGEYYHEVEDYQLAIQKFDYALSMPGRGTRETMVGYYKRGLSKQALEQTEAAIRDLEIAVNTPLQHTEAIQIEAWALLGQLYFENEQYCEASKAIKKAIAMDNETPTVEEVEDLALWLGRIHQKSPNPCR